jgi:predicted nucleotidyltransferase
MENAIKAELDSLIADIKKSVPVKEIYLFGSYVYGKPDSDSDFDIYVIIPDNTLRPLDAMQKISIAISDGQKHPVDVLVGNYTAFNERKSQPTIEREVALKGIKIYA